MIVGHIIGHQMLDRWAPRRLLIYIHFIFSGVFEIKIKVEANKLKLGLEYLKESLFNQVTTT